LARRDARQYAPGVQCPHNAKPRLSAGLCGSGGQALAAAIAAALTRILGLLAGLLAAALLLAGLLLPALLLLAVITLMLARILVLLSRVWVLWILAHERSPVAQPLTGKRAG
jgi:hypothetical protein